MKSIISLILVLISFVVSSQIQFDKTKHDLGELSLNSPRFVDVYLKNTSNKTHYILSIKQPAEVTYIKQGSMILPGESIAIRFQANPKRKGKFNYIIPIYTSDKREATNFQIKGDLRVLPPNRNSNFTACPNFGQSPANGNPLDFELTVITRDAETKAPLGKSEVTLLQNGREIAQHKTNRNGEFTKATPLGYTYFYATHSGYNAAELGTYVNFKRNYVIIDLDKKEEEIVEIPETIEEEIVVVENTEEEKPEEIVVEIEEEQIVEVPEEIVVEVEIAQEVEETEPEITEVEVAETPKPNFEDVPADDFSSANFKPMNVVFVIDVSSSMKQGDKLELMKYALYQLTDMLRPQDKIGLVSYATNTKVLLAPTSGENKDKIKDIVSDMKASGLTAGGAGIKLGFKQAKRNKIENGSNMVIVITDGGFNRNSDDYKKYIRRYKRKGIKLSVVGIQNKDKVKDNMEEAAHLGDGRYVPIFKLEDAKHNLKQEIRKSSYRY